LDMGFVAGLLLMTPATYVGLFSLHQFFGTSVSA
jgi:hypothetical protein